MSVQRRGSLPIPSRRALALWSVLLALAFVAAWRPELHPPWLIAVGVALAATIADLAASWALPPRLTLERRLPASVPIGRW